MYYLKKREREKKERDSERLIRRKTRFFHFWWRRRRRERESKVYSINGQKSHHLADSMMEYNWSFSFNRARVCVSMRLFFHLSIHSIRAVRSSFYAFLRRSAAERNDSKSPLAHLLLLLRPFLVTSGNFDHWWKADNYWVYLLRQKSGEAENENLFFFPPFFFSLSLLLPGSTSVPPLCLGI